MPRVAIARTGETDEALADAVRRCVELTGGLGDFVRPGSRVLVKPNIVAPLARGVTHFTVLRTVIERLRDAGRLPFLRGVGRRTDQDFGAEHPAHHGQGEVRRSEMHPVCAGRQRNVGAVVAHARCVVFPGHCTQFPCFPELYRRGFLLAPVLQEPGAPGKCGPGDPERIPFPTDNHTESDVPSIQGTAQFHQSCTFSRKVV